MVECCKGIFRKVAISKLPWQCGWQTHQNQGTISVGTNYFCYKKFFSLVLMAACDADYRFVWMDIGQYGKCRASKIKIQYHKQKMIMRFDFF